MCVTSSVGTMSDSEVDEETRNEVNHEVNYEVHHEVNHEVHYEVHYEVIHGVSHEVVKVANSEMSHEVNHEVTYEVHYEVIHEVSRNRSNPATVLCRHARFKHLVTASVSRKTVHVPLNGNVVCTMMRQMQACSPNFEWAALV